MPLGLWLKKCKKVPFGVACDCSWLAISLKTLMHLYCAHNKASTSIPVHDSVLTKYTQRRSIAFIFWSDAEPAMCLCRAYLANLRSEASWVKILGLRFAATVPAALLPPRLHRSKRSTDSLPISNSRSSSWLRRLWSFVTPWALVLWAIVSNSCTVTITFNYLWHTQIWNWSRFHTVCLIQIAFLQALPRRILLWAVQTLYRAIKVLLTNVAMASFSVSRYNLHATS